ncbi:3,4-dihydroxy-2-butanone-4-phosphate synthase (plasmid) [Sphingobium sp. SJ10-10]|uniref:3,4-dihydroxy-2-butanone-4-phosphate synthase n=1 Tax=Sphingobium sp. SJ10-10 TaxID=3114999 RepID=UPI002E18E6EF|nr:3,4-dihydroxy-2-butanone-4-phosphate synthase [Sphingobium sp. SJ10-10]
MLAKTLNHNPADHDTAYGIFDTVAELIHEIRNGQIVIVHDQSADRGFLVGAAQMASPTMINFMAHHGRGLICLALTRQRIDELALPMMNDGAAQRDGRAFTVSIEARHGVTTGISAADRARTIATAVYTTDASVEIVTPGHVFPLRASDGGVLARAGHVEAATDLPRLAGMNPSGVICGIINDKGEDAGLNDLMILARHLDLKIGNIQDMVVFRQKQDRFVHCSANSSFESSHAGEWRIKIFTSEIDPSETIVLQKGEVGLGRGVPLELRACSPLTGLFPDAGGDDSLSRTMDRIGEHGSGIVILTPETASGSLMKALRKQRTENRLYQHDFGKIAQILTELDVQSTKLLNHCDLTAAKLRSAGVSVVI